MEKTRRVISLFGLLALTLFMLSFASASSFADISRVDVNDMTITSFPSESNIGVNAGQVIPVTVFFNAMQDAQDVRVKIELSGDQGYSFSSERFDVYNGSSYTRTVSVKVPSAIDPKETLYLEVSVDSKDNPGVTKTIRLSGEREAYVVDLVDVEMNNKVASGDTLSLNVVLKNRGGHLAEDTFVKARIPALGVEDRAYFGDLSAVDQSNPDKEDAAERMLFLKIPSSAPAGIYVVEVEAYNSDASQTVTEKVAIVGASADTSVVSSTSSKILKVGETASYSVTLVNSGDKVRIYEFVPEATTGLKVDARDSIVAVPAGSSKTVMLDATASKSGKYSFAVNVYSDSELVKKLNFVANAEGSSGMTGNVTVLLTVVLAIIFVVLLVVLIVLLTRKQAKTEEFGESYY